MRDIHHPVFGTLSLVHEIPHINMHWWLGSARFLPARASVRLEIHGLPTGPTDAQPHAFLKLMHNYSTLIQRGIENGDVPGPDSPCRLETIKLYADGQMDLVFVANGVEHRLYADAQGAYLAPAEALER